MILSDSTRKKREKKCSLFFRERHIRTYNVPFIYLLLTAKCPNCACLLETVVKFLSLTCTWIWLVGEDGTRRKFSVSCPADHFCLSTNVSDSNPADHFIIKKGREKKSLQLHAASKKLPRELHELWFKQLNLEEKGERERRVSRKKRFETSHLWFELFCFPWKSLNVSKHSNSKPGFVLSLWWTNLRPY